MKAAFALLWLSLALILWGCSDEGISSPSEEERRMNYQLGEFSAEHRRNGELRWKVKGEAAVFFKNETAQIVKPTLVIFKDGEKAAVVTGERGMVDQRSKDVQILGKVVGISEEGRFYAEEVYWDDSNGELYAPGKVKVVKGRSVLWGEEMRADPNLRHIRLKKITFKVRSEDEKHREELPDVQID